MSGTDEVAQPPGGAARRALPSAVAPRPPVRVLVVAATRTRGTALADLLTAAGSVVVLATARTPQEAEAQALARRPDVVLVDLDATGGGLEAIERIMSTCPTPVVACGAGPQTGPQALAAGAVDTVAVRDPAGHGPPVDDVLASRLQSASRVRVITHPRGRLRARGWAPPTGVPEAVATPPEATRERPALVVIGTSTGGPPALATILAGLPVGLPVPVLVVQHMGDGFVEGLARWLDGMSALPVGVAVDGTRLQPGHVVLAPAGVNTTVTSGGRLRMLPPGPAQFHVPGIDETFSSTAAVYGRRALGVLLTGMGRDGAQGLCAMRQAGASTFAQDEATSAVWGMPGVAVHLGAVCRVLALPDIAAAILDALHPAADADARGATPCPRTGVAG